MRTAKVRFLVDFRGKLTNEVFYTAGSEADINISAATLLVEEERAVMVEQVEEMPVTVETETTEPATEDKPKRGRKPKA